MKRKHALHYLVGLIALVLVIMPLSACSAPDDTSRLQFEDTAAVDDAADLVEIVGDDADWAGEPADDDDWGLDDAAFDAEYWEGTVQDDGDVNIEYGESIGVLPILLPSETGRQLVYNVDMHFQTTEFMVGVRDMLDEVRDLGGYSEEVLVHGRPILRPYIKRSASGTFRIPTINLNEFIIFMEENYNLLFLHQRMIDHTIAYESDQAALERLREQEQRLLADLDDDEEEDTNAIREDLDAIRDNIRELEAATSSLERDVVYSTVVVVLDEVIIPIEEEEIEEEEEEEIIPPTFGERFLDTMESSLGNLLIVSQAMFLVIFAILPWILPPAILIILIILAIRKSRRKNRLRAANTPPHPFDPNPPAQM